MVNDPWSMDGWVPACRVQRSNITVCVCGKTLTPSLSLKNILFLSNITSWERVMIPLRMRGLDVGAGSSVCVCGGGEDKSLIILLTAFNL